MLLFLVRLCSLNYFICLLFSTYEIDKLLHLPPPKKFLAFKLREEETDLPNDQSPPCYQSPSCPSLAWQPAGFEFSYWWSVFNAKVKKSAPTNYLKLSLVTELRWYWTVLARVTCCRPVYIPQCPVSPSWNGALFLAGIENELKPLCCTANFFYFCKSVFQHKSHKYEVRAES